MKHETAYELPTATNILSLESAEMPGFVQECLRTRSLSWVVAELNKSILSGPEEERDEARKALEHLGFI